MQTLPKNVTKVERTTFSAAPQVESILKAQRSAGTEAEEGKSNVVVFGMEAHGAVLQTTLALLRQVQPGEW